MRWKIDLEFNQIQKLISGEPNKIKYVSSAFGKSDMGKLFQHVLVEDQQTKYVIGTKCKKIV